MKIIEVNIRLFSISPLLVETLSVNDFNAYDNGRNPLSNLILFLSSTLFDRWLSNLNLILFHGNNLPVVNYNLDNTPLIASYAVLT